MQAARRSTGRRTVAAGGAVALAGVAALAAAAAAMATACTPDDMGTPPEIEVASAVDMGTIQAGPLVKGRDGGYSALFRGRSVWLFGDTIISVENRYGVMWDHNSWSWTEALDATDGISGLTEPTDEAGAPAEFFPQTAEERAYNLVHFEERTEEPLGARMAVWPGAIVVDEDRDRALAFYFEIRARPGAFEFEAVGSSLAVWTDFDAGPVRGEFGVDPDHPTLLFVAGHDPLFGSAALIAGGMLYAYSSQGGGERKPVRIARVPVASCEDRDAWEFWAGPDRGWVPEIDDAAAVFYGSDIMSVFRMEAVGRYVALYSRPMSRSICLRTAPAPEGPWTRQICPVEAARPDQDPHWVYDALAHPELSDDDPFAIHVSYSRSTPGFLESELRQLRLVVSPLP